MATRKSRMNTESPTPSSGSESIPSTPTTLSTRTRGRKLQKEAETPTAATPTPAEKPAEEDEDTAKSQPQDDDDQMDEKELLAEARKEAAKEPSASVRKRRLAALRDESPSVSDKSGDNKTPSTTTSSANTSTSEKSGTAAAAATAVAEMDDNSSGMAKRPRRSVLKLTDTPPLKLTKRRNSTGSKAEPGGGGSGQRLSSRIRSLKMRKTKLMKKKPMLNKKPAAASTVSRPLRAALLAEKQTAASAAAKKVVKIEKSTDSAASDSELLKIDRRRSDSLSKCSDATDTSSFPETSHTDGDAVTTSDPQASDVKEETAIKDDDGKSTPIKDVKKEEPVSRDSDVGESTPDTKTDANDGDKRPARRLRRNMWLPPPKTIATRSRSETPNKENTTKNDGNATDDKEATTSVTVKQEALDSLETPLHIETATSNELSEKVGDDAAMNAPISSGSGAGDDAPVDNKSESLSPVLVSEGVSEHSVKQFYSQPDFLENNLGIEEDPKLGEIVQVKEKIKNEDSDKLTKKQVIDNNNADDELKKNIMDKNENEPKIVDDEKVDAKNEETIISADSEYTKTKKSVEESENDADVKLDGGAKNEIEPEEKTPLANNENVIVLSGEVEVRPKSSSRKKADDVKDEEAAGEVVLYAITNGVRTKAGSLETVLENQKRKNSTESEKEGIVDTEMDEAIDAGSIKSDETDAVQKTETDINECKEPLQSDENARSADAKEDEPENKIAATDTAIGQAKDDDTTTHADIVSEHDDNSNGSDVNKENINTGSENDESKADAQRETPRTVESLRVTKQKESHLKTLGLLTHQEAVTVRIEKEKRREQRKSSAASSSSSTTSNGKGKKNGQEYTGTLKTVIKLHRGNADKKKMRGPLKLTLSKSRGKPANGDRDGSSAGNSEEDTYYTIHSEVCHLISMHCKLHNFNQVFELILKI